MKLSKELYNFLVYHIIELQKNKTAIARHYSTEFDAYMKMLGFLNTYIEKIEDILDRAQRVTEHISAPFVILNCVAEVENLPDGALNKYRVSLPGADLLPVKSGLTDVTCFSPIGSELLFKPVNDKIILPLKNENKSMVIRNIDYALNL